MTKIVPKALPIDATKSVSIEDLLKKRVLVSKDRLKSFYDLTLLLRSDSALSIKFTKERATAIRMLLLVQRGPGDDLCYALKPSVKIER
jgi:hypothetical protein